MEFPDLGKHCSVDSCKQLDFLPVKCDSCNKIFCKDHYAYETHDCTESYRKDNQVPVCPLCNTPIAVKRGEPPDIKVGQHIDNDCDSDRARQRRKASQNRCKAVGCKKKELIPFMCQRCGKNFCIKHRHEEDHKCEGVQGSGRGMNSSGAAAMKRLQGGGSGASQRPAPRSTHTDRERRDRSSQPAASRVQGNLSEDEAMAQAIAASLHTSGQPQPPQPPVANTQEEEDLALARALQLSEEEARRQRPPAARRQTSSSKDKCMVS